MDALKREFRGIISGEAVSLAFLAGTIKNMFFSHDLWCESRYIIIYKSVNTLLVNCQPLVLTYSQAYSKTRYAAAYGGEVDFTLLLTGTLQKFQYFLFLS